MLAFSSKHRCVWVQPHRAASRLCILFLFFSYVSLEVTPFLRNPPDSLLQLLLSMNKEQVEFVPQRQYKGQIHRTASEDRTPFCRKYTDAVCRCCFSRYEGYRARRKYAIFICIRKKRHNFRNGLKIFLIMQQMEYFFIQTVRSLWEFWKYLQNSRNLARTPMWGPNVHLGWYVVPIWATHLGLSHFVLSTHGGPTWVRLDGLMKGP